MPLFVGKVRVQACRGGPRGFLARKDKEKQQRNAGIGQVPAAKS